MSLHSTLKLPGHCWPSTLLMQTTVFWRKFGLMIWSSGHCVQCPMFCPNSSIQKNPSVQSPLLKNCVSHSQVPNGFSVVTGSGFGGTSAGHPSRNPPRPGHCPSSGTQSHLNETDEDEKHFPSTYQSNFLLQRVEVDGDLVTWITFQGAAWAWKQKGVARHGLRAVTAHLESSIRTPL